jgi:hypothetical protein
MGDIMRDGRMTSAPRYFITEASDAEALFNTVIDRINRHFTCGDLLGAREMAFYWAECITDKLGLAHFTSWKSFKRNVAERWFGRVERRTFPPGWDPDDVLRYADGFSGTHVRISLFKPNIACHATSVRLPGGAWQTRCKFLQQLTNTCTIEVFPESSGPTKICFRRFSTLFGEDVFYEAAHGQAMNAFEMRQGRNAVGRALKTSDGYHYTPAGPASRRSATVVKALSKLIAHHDAVLGMASFGLCRTLGIEQVLAEGYFDRQDNAAVVVDIDLPLDRVFMPR